MNAQTNELLEGVLLQLDEEVLDESYQSLHDLMESVGYEIDADTLEEALGAVSAFMESAEFAALSEKEQSKVKKGFKMVFGKLLKMGGKAKRALGGALAKMGVKQGYRPDTKRETHMKRWSAQMAKQKAAVGRPKNPNLPPVPRRKPAPK
jgi:hypothetical protein